MATIFRCSRVIDFKKRNNLKTLQNAIVRGHFLDLTKLDNPIVRYLWSLIIDE